MIVHWDELIKTRISTLESILEGTAEGDFGAGSRLDRSFPTLISIVEGAARVKASMVWNR
jgi:hypothetical protein